MVVCYSHKESRKQCCDVEVYNRWRLLNVEVTAGWGRRESFKVRTQGSASISQITLMMTLNIFKVGQHFSS